MVATAGNVDMQLVVDGFIKMSRGYGEINEFNTEPGVYDHGTGWGAVIENSTGYARHRSLLPVWQDHEVHYLVDKKVPMLHARRATIGGKEIKNTHPFKLRHLGRDWYFCHNGHNADCFEPFDGMEGDTDSEMLFKYLLDRYDDKRPLASVEDAVTVMESLPYEALSSFLFDGRQLFAVNVYRTRPNYYQFNFNQTDRGILISTEKLPEIEGEWKLLENGQIGKIDFDKMEFEIS